MSDFAFDQPGDDSRPAEEPELTGEPQVASEPLTDEAREVAPPTTDSPGDTPADILDDDVPVAPEVDAVSVDADVPEEGAEEPVAAEPEEPMAAEAEPGEETPEPIFSAADLGLV